VFSFVFSALCARNFTIICNSISTSVIAYGAVAFARRLFAKVRTYADTKRCWSPGGKTPTLFEVSASLRAVFADADAVFSRLERLNQRIEGELTCACAFIFVLVHCSPFTRVQRAGRLERL
jgi:hypothetical protein